MNGERRLRCIKRECKRGKKIEIEGGREGGSRAEKMGEGVKTKMQ